jgi:uncharacterized protein YndB with AHSA1/START domain
LEIQIARKYSMILKILFFAALAVVAVLLFAATKPNGFRVQRSIDIHAQPEKIFVLINDFHNWTRWTPQDREDSTMRRTYSGPTSGKGAASQWSSTGKAGKGQLLIAESAPPSRILVNAEFIKPFQSHNLNEFILEPRGADTHVTWTWTVQGKTPYIMKLMGVFVNMDRMMGRHFEDGLRNLKSVSEQ